MPLRNHPSSVTPHGLTLFPTRRYGALGPFRDYPETQLGGVATTLMTDVAPVPDTKAGASEDALTALIRLVGPDLEACNRTIVARMDSPVALIPQLAAHIVAAGGKRLQIGRAHV